MNTLSIILYLFATTCLYAGVHHLLFFIRRPKDKTNLLFSLMCIVHVGYFIVQGLWYSSSDPIRSLVLVQYAYSLISLVMILQLWFFYLYCDKSFSKWWCIASIPFFGIFSVASLITDTSTLSLQGGYIKQATIFGWIETTSYEYQPGILLELLLLCVFLTMIFLFVIVMKHSLKRFGTTLKPMPVAWAVVVVAAILDALSAGGILHTIYLSEFAYTLLILCMAYRLSSDFIDAMNEVERLNASLDMIVRERTSELEDKNRELEVLSTTDQLTELYNRRHAEHILEQQLHLCERYETPLSVILIDIDHFKAVNDTYGHDAGDRVLMAVARTIQYCIRNTDAAARWGGEEFLVLAPETEINICTTLAERLRKKISTYTHDRCGQITASFGIANYQPGDSASTIIKRADMGLYEAKSQGRDCVVVK